MPTHLAVAAGTHTARRILTTNAVAALLAVAVTALAITATLDPSPSAGEASYRPSPAALADIPGNYLRLYLDAEQTRSVDWAILAAIGSIETDHGRSTRPGVRTGGIDGRAHRLTASYDAGLSSAMGAGSSDGL